MNYVLQAQKRTTISEAENHDDSEEDTMNGDKGDGKLSLLDERPTFATVIAVCLDIIVKILAGV